jgi:HSP20 family molecular chaperone IbpA
VLLVYSFTPSLPEKDWVETIQIKKNNLGKYVLYGLVKYKINENGKERNALISIKSDNLRFKYDALLNASREYQTVYSGRGNPIMDFYSSVTRHLLHNFTFENIDNVSDVLIELTVLNGKENEFMNYSIYEDLEKFYVHINVAGLTKEEIKVSHEDGVIYVNTYPYESELSNETEIMVQNFKPEKTSCEIYLPKVDMETIGAKLENGVLYLTIDKLNKKKIVNIQ